MEFLVSPGPILRTSEPHEDGGYLIGSAYMEHVSFNAEGFIGWRSTGPAVSSDAGSVWFFLACSLSAHFCKTFSCGGTQAKVSAPHEACVPSEQASCVLRSQAQRACLVLSHLGWFHPPALAVCSQEREWAVSVGWCIPGKYECSFFCLLPPALPWLHLE